MNEKLEKVLKAFYNNPNDFQQACVEELCDRRIPDSANFVTFFADKQVSERKTYFNEVENNFQQSIAGSMNQESKNQIDELASKIAKASVSVSPKAPAKPKVKTIIEEESKLLDKKIKGELLKNFETIAEKNETSFYISIIATTFVTLVKSKKLAEPDQNKNLTELYTLATKLILASKPKHLQGNLQEAVLKQIANTCDEKVQKAVQNFLNEVEKKVQLSASAPSSETPCQTTEENGRMLRYYQDGKAVSLIQNEELPDPAPSIEEAIKNFDLNDKSNLLKFALENIEEKVRENFNKNNISDKHVIPAAEAVFLTLCHQFGKEVDDNVLFAISDPLSDMLNDSPLTPNALTAIKDICKEISGKEVEFEEEPAPIADNIAKPVDDITKPKDDITKPKDDITKPKDDITKPVDDVTKPVDDITKPEADEYEPIIKDVGEIPPADSSDARGHERTIEDAIKKLKKSFLKIENLKTKKSIAPAIKNAKQKVSGLHYRFVGKPEFGKTKKPPKHVSETERDLMGNLNIGRGKGEANKIASEIIATLTTIYQTQLQVIKATIDNLKARVRAGKKIGEEEIENLNKTIEAYNASTNPKVLLRTFSRMFLSKLKDANLVTEEYEKAFEEKHPKLTNTEEPEII